MPITPRQKAQLKTLLKQFDDNLKQSLDAAFAQNKATDLLEDITRILNTQTTTTQTNAAKAKKKDPGK